MVSEAIRAIEAKQEKDEEVGRALRLVLMHNSLNF